MAKTPPNLVEDSIKPYISSKNYPQKAKGLSFYASLFSIFIYISVLYIFNLSPSALFYNTKFWFFLSNTLILIIAVDYGAYSSSNEKQDLYQEYVKRTQVKNVPSFVPQYQKIVKQSTPKQKVDSFQEKREVIVQEVQVFPERNLQVVIKSDSEKPSEDLREKIKAKTYRRSKSEQAKRVVIDESKNIITRSSETEKNEENEFSTMSDEELNRRVEEFIQRFNREIRLQSTS
ncbi:uncharacterized protein LOC115993012 [Quercus lobata]|uniref:Uncharacterized protein n=1 Tax=Quercus lobata TaxID=97700 RepID=A0A7N2LQF9_QUELO|nr:uncharacterized protein LOC115993012 [Quercus lobata]